MSIDFQKIPVFLRSDPDTVVQHLSFSDRDELVGFLQGPWWSKLGYDEPAGLDLTGIDLSGMDLSHRSFWCSKMANANLSDSILIEAKFQETDLTGAVFDRANMTRVHFTQTSLTYPNKGIQTLKLGGAALKNASFHAAIMERAQVSGSDFSGANFYGAVLRGSLMRECNFYKADFEGADISGSDITGSNFLAARISRAQLGEARHAGLLSGPDDMPAKMNRMRRKKPQSPRFS